ncbi:ZYBA0S14-01222g1_1 [Zygosaccharomyces bailii CLIB 213]|uniref:Kinetochore protein SPC25 n=1 Tax=Zygosaccharomyces bailii (strain CLIB 213 / ATCC 58445 / CBS 680 / BCRC 21525 / NBRC 1098 / NCYC 1416 / NRRL Y-2227) TaxID=1333698 RepID=A0A8J2TCE2_ZYGB2|nr:ZYBA0S14-01222g1_1 [Zygosaccharomyces bailii CLIB 213]
MDFLSRFCLCRYDAGTNLISVYCRERKGPQKMNDKIDSFPEFRQRMAAFEQRVYQALHERTSSAALAVQRYKDEVNQLANRQRVLEEKLRQQRELEVKLRNDQEVAKKDAESVRSRLGTFKIRQQQLEAQQAALVEEGKELDSLMSQKQQEIQQRRRLLLKQQQRDAPEVQLYEELLGMRVDASQQGTLQFTFHHLDEQNSNSSCQLTLDVSGEQFVLLDTNPPLETEQQRQQLTQNFNSNNDIKSFLVEARSTLASRVLSDVVRDC